MKKTLVVIRHAKTEQQQNDQQDFDRNLTDRGKNDALMMGNRLRAMGLRPDLILASPANRTLQTSRIIAGAIGYDESAIATSGQLYQSSSQVIEHVLTGLPDEVNTCFLIAHNPGISQFVYDAQKELFIGELPTTGIVILNIAADNWQDIPAAKKQLVVFDHPKK
jgi:phosphohistidine phosphatase